jgi:hypothetical protein
MRTVSGWLRPLASVLLTALFAAAGCSSGSGDLRDGTYAADHGYDFEFAEPNPGEACTRDAIVTCGYNRLGTKVCTCAGGVYTQCPCFPPKDWKGALTAPYCDALTATAAALRGQTCTGLIGTECIDRSQPDPTEREGCSCIKGTAGAQWGCGAPGMLGVSEHAVSCIEFSVGTIAYLDNDPCSIEWQECIARDFVDGTTQRGCACLSTNGTLRWECGSTNKWFVPE